MSAFRAWAVWLLLAFLVLTNRWMSWQQAIEFVQAGDVLSYQAIAEKAPELPYDSKLLQHHAQRFVPHFLLGCLSKVSGLSIATVYRVAMALVVAGLLWVAHLLFSAATRSSLAYAVCFALFLLNPYVFRYYALVPGMVTDAIFVLGLAIILLGCMRQHRLLTIVGFAVAVVGRQTVILAVPGALLWMASHDRQKKTIFAGAAVTAVAFGGYWISSQIAAGFSTPVNLFNELIFRERRALPAVMVLEHVVRVFAPFLCAAAVAFAACRRGPWLSGVLGPLLIWAGIISQPLLFTPYTVARNQGRLAALGLLPLLLAIAHSWRPGTSTKKWALSAVVLALAFHSLHHLFSVWGPGSAQAFLAWQLGAAFVLLVALKSNLKA